MRALNVVAAIGGLLIALISAPLFHYHERDDHGSRPLVHAHLSDHDDDHSHSHSESETPNSHEIHGKWIDLFLAKTTVLSIYQVAMDVSEPLPVPFIEIVESFGSVEIVRAHSPPASLQPPPRSPPLL